MSLQHRTKPTGLSYMLSCTYLPYITSPPRQSVSNSWSYILKKREETGKTWQIRKKRGKNRKNGKKLELSQKYAKSIQKVPKRSPKGHQKVTKMSLKGLWKAFEMPPKYQQKAPKRPPKGPQTVTERSSKGHQKVTKRSPKGHQKATKWPPKGNQNAINCH